MVTVAVIGTSTTSIPSDPRMSVKVAVPSGHEAISRRTSRSVWSTSSVIRAASRSRPCRSASPSSARSATEQAATWAPRSPRVIRGMRTFASMILKTSSTGSPAA